MTGRWSQFLFELLKWLEFLNSIAQTVYCMKSSLEGFLMKFYLFFCRCPCTNGLSLPKGTFCFRRWFLTEKIYWLGFYCIHQVRNSPSKFEIIAVILRLMFPQNKFVELQKYLFRIYDADRMKDQVINFMTMNKTFSLVSLHNIMERLYTYNQVGEMIWIGHFLINWIEV
jgi:hypothetical protein